MHKSTLSLSFSLSLDILTLPSLYKPPFKPTTTAFCAHHLPLPIPHSTHFQLDSHNYMVTTNTEIIQKEYCNKTIRCLGFIERFISSLLCATMKRIYCVVEDNTYTIVLVAHTKHISKTSNDKRKLWLRPNIHYETVSNDSIQQKTSIYESGLKCSDVKLCHFDYIFCTLNERCTLVTLWLAFHSSIHALRFLPHTHT